MATTKKTNIPSQRKPDALTVSKADFKARLLERIESGKALESRSITNMAELEANKRDYYKWNDYNSELLKSSFNNIDNEYKRDYDNVNMSFFGISGRDTPEGKLKNLKDDIKNKVEELEQLVDKIELLKSEVEINDIKLYQTVKDYSKNSQIFIVHGHNPTIQVTVARTLEHLGFTPVILHEQPNAGRTIIEKFEAHSDVGFAIILLTDDDEGKSKTEIDLKKRARQNVVLELGYFIGKLGRNRVLPLYSEGVELPSDIYGLVYVPIDNAGRWKFSIVQELKAADMMLMRT